MHHLSAFYVEDKETEEKFGTIEICQIPIEENSYGYYFRSLSGEYTQLIELKSMSVKECRAFEESQLHEIANRHIETLEVKDWNIYRTRPTIWDDAGLISPEISCRAYLESKQYLFEDDPE